MTPPRATSDGSRFAALLSSPWTAGICVALAGAALATSLVIVTTRYDAAAASALASVDSDAPESPSSTTLPAGERAPSDFDLSLSATTLPMVKRGETVSLLITASAAAQVERIEVWRDDEPYYQVTGDAIAGASVTGTVRVPLDAVNLTAGGHIFLARAFGAGGMMAQSAPLATPTMDLDLDLVAQAPLDAPWPGFSLAASPSDTLGTIAARLGVSAADLAAADGTTDVDALLDPGTRVTGTVPLAGTVKPSSIPTFPGGTDVHAVVDGCEAVITSTTAGTVRIYGGAGMVALGDIADGQELRLATLPVGKTVLAAYPVTAPQGALPSSPRVVTIPDECAEDGWTGNARITGGIMVTDDAVALPYAYIAVDKGEWQRIPARDGQFLSAGSASLADLRHYIDLAHYDQIDLEVWSGQSPTGPEATGQYCRASSQHPHSSASSGSTGECAPPAAVPTGAPGTLPAASFTLAVRQEPQKAGKTLYERIPIEGSAATMPWYDLTGPGTVQFTADSPVKTAYRDFLLQFSYIPLSPATTGVDLPGVFATARALAYGTVTKDVWMWHSAKVTAESLTGVDGLSLTDQTALQIALGRLAAGQNLIDEVYVRAVAVSGSAGSTVSLGAVSNTIKITMPASLDGTWPSLASPKLGLTPGVRLTNFNDIDRPTSATDKYGKPNSAKAPCVQVVSYPQPDTWTTVPSHGPLWQQPSGATYGGSQRSPQDVKIGEPVVANHSDLALAEYHWPKKDVIYCLDQWAEDKRKAEADARESTAECGVGCVLLFVVYGAAQGLAMGGPVGALIGAVAGLAVGVGSALSPEFYASVLELWDMVADTYNGVFQTVWKVIEVINPVCLMAKGWFGDKTGDICHSAVVSVGSQLFEYYTGLPPQIPNSAAMQATSRGNLEAVAYLLVSQAFKAAGVSCDAASLSGAQSEALAYGLTKVGVDTSYLTGPDGNLSACGTFGKALAMGVQQAIDRRNENVMASLTGYSAVQGLTLGLVAPTQPVITFTAKAGANPTSLTQCPVTLNISITEDGTTYRLYPQQMTVTRQPTLAGLAGVSTGTWTGAFTVPRHTTPYWAMQHSVPVRDAVPAVAGAYYLHVEADSPCFEGTQTLDAGEYALAPYPGAFMLDPRPIVTYW